jgi:hypothetical protein
MAAMNGVLLFGWSTAVIFEVLREAIRFRTPQRLEDVLEQRSTSVLSPIPYEWSR